MATPPSAPIIRHAPKASPNTLEYFWYPPTNPGSPAVTGYRLTLQPGNLVYTFGLTDYYMVTGLTNGQTYQTTVEATNDGGSSYGPPASFREFQPGFPPVAPPLTGVATFINVSTAVVSWTPPAIIPTAQIFWYVIKSQSTSPLDPVLSTNALASATSNVIIAGLNSNSQYSFTIKPVNCPGYGPQIVTSTTSFLFPFFPIQLGGIRLWLDASDGTTVTSSGGFASQWRDLTSNAFPLTQATAGSQPGYLNNAILLSTNRFFDIGMSTINATSNYTFVFTMNPQATSNTILVKQHDGNNTFNVMTMSYTTSGGGITQNGVPNALYWRTNNGGGYISTPALTLRSTTVISIGYDGGAAQMNSNGAYGNSITGAFGINDAPTTTTSRFGSWSANPTLNNTGLNMNEFLFFNQGLSVYNRQKVEGYLAWKWGTQSNLPSSHPFRNSRPYSNVFDFYPTQVYGIQAWYDGADPLNTGSAPANGTSITRWFDKSTYNNDAVAVSAAPYVVDATNGNYLNFNGTAQYTITSNGFVVNQYYTVFVVERLQSASGNFPLFGGSGGSANTNLNAYYSGTNSVQIRFNQYANDLIGSAPPYVDAASQPSRIWSFSQQNQDREIFLYGSTIVSNNSNTFLSSWAGAQLGWAAGSSPYPGHLREYIFYNGLMGNYERQRVEGYLAWKWNLQNFLPLSHPYKSVVPKTSDEFLPTLLGGVDIWLDASDATTFTYSGANITRWADKSGLNNHITYTSGGNYAIRTTDGSKSIVRFPNAASQYNSALSRVYTTNLFTVFYVMKKTNTKYTQWFSAGGVNTIYDYGPFLGCLYNGPPPGNGDGSAFFIVNGTRNTVISATYTNYHLVRGRGNGGTTNIRVGVNHPSDYFYGDICEIIVFNRNVVLTEQQQQRIEGYLAWKWGLQTLLQPQHPYKNKAPTIDF